MTPLLQLHPSPLLATQPSPPAGSAADVQVASSQPQNEEPKEQAPVAADTTTSAFKRKQYIPSAHLLSGRSRAAWEVYVPHALPGSTVLQLSRLVRRESSAVGSWVCSCSTLAWRPARPLRRQKV